MNKASTIIVEKCPYTIQLLIDHIALVKSVTGKVGLFNVKTGEAIGDLDYFHSIYSKEYPFYMLNKTISVFEEGKKERENRVTLYDVKKESMVAENWKVLETFDYNNPCCTLESAKDHRKHIFDLCLYSTNPDFFDEEFEQVEFLYRLFDFLFLRVLQNGKWGIFQQGKGIIKPIEYDSIEKKKNIIIFTKGKEKFFVFDSNLTHGETSVLCEDITFDKNNNNIVYCKKGSTIFVYDIELNQFLFQVDHEELQFLTKVENSFNRRYGELFFAFRHDTKYGLLSMITSPDLSEESELKATVNTLLDANFDLLSYSSGVFHLQENDKHGLFRKGNPGIYVEPNYDDVTNLGYWFFAFYAGEVCDIYKVHTSLQPFITQCQIHENLDHHLIFTKNHSFGLLTPSVSRAHHTEDIILEPYDSINHLGHNYFELDSKEKKGVCYRGIIIIPLEYKNIKFHFCSSINKQEHAYFALQQGQDDFLLARKWHYYSTDSEVQIINDQPYQAIDFFEDFMVLRDQNDTCLYTYDEELIKTLPHDVIISSPQQPNQKHIYFIDGSSYVFQYGALVKMLVEECDLYVTSYEGIFGSVVVQSYNKAEHDSICELIEGSGEDYIDQTIASIYEDHPEYRGKQPVLIKRMLPSTSSIASLPLK